MVKRIIKSNYLNILQAALGAGLFYFSFYVGEGSMLGGICHLSGCAVFCGAIHGMHDLDKH